MLVITTVTVPPSTLDLTNLATVKDELGITSPNSDASISRWITAASKEVAAYCNRVFPLQTQIDKIFPSRDCYSVVSGERPQPIQLTGWPVASSPSSVIEDGATLAEGADFLTDYARGQLSRIDANVW